MVEVGDCAHQGRKAGRAAGETGSRGEVVFGYDAEGIGREWRQCRVLFLEGLPEASQLSEAGLSSGTGDILGL